MVMAGTFLMVIGFLAFGFFKIQQQWQLNNTKMELLNQAHTLVAEGQFAEAVKLCETISPDLFDRKPFAKASFEHSYGIALYQLGQSNQQADLLHKALPFLKNAVDTWERINWKAKKASALNDLGRVYSLLAFFEQKPAYLEQAFAILRRTLRLPGVKKAPALHASIHLSLAMVCYHLFLNQNQLDFLTNAFEFLGSAQRYFNEHPARETSLTNLYLSLCYLELARMKNPAANLKKALDYALAARQDLCLQPNSLFTQLFWFTLGEIYFSLSKYEEPSRDLALAYRAYRKGLISNPAPALSHYHTQSCLALGNIYHYFGDNNHKPRHLLRALSWIAKALSGLTLENQPQPYLSCYLLQGSLYARLAEFAQPLENLTKALQVYAAILDLPNFHLSAEMATTVHSKIGFLSTKLAELEQPEHHLAQAAESFTAALRVRRFATENEAEKVELFLDNILQKIERIKLNQENSSRLLGAYRRLITLFDPANSPEEFAAYNAKLGWLHQQAAMLDNPVVNYHQSITHLEQAGEIHKSLHNTKKHAAVLADLAKSHLELSRLENSESNLDKALRLYNQAHQIFSTAKFAKEQTLIQIGIGTAHRLLAQTQNRLSNLTKSLRALDFAFNALDAKEQPQEFLAVLVELGLTHSQTAEYSEPKYHLSKAVYFFKKALDFPLPDSRKNMLQIKNEYAQTLMRLADYHQAIQNLQEAIALFSSLLEQSQPSQSPHEVVLLLNHLALCYQKLSEVSLDSKKEHLSQALYLLEHSLTLITAENFPLDYAMTQNNLGIAYSRLAKITERDANSKKARLALEQALKIYTPETYPDEHQKVNENLERLAVLKR